MTLINSKQKRTAVYAKALMGLRSRCASPAIIQQVRGERNNTIDTPYKGGQVIFRPVASAKHFVIVVRGIDENIGINAG